MTTTALGSLSVAQLSLGVSLTMPQLTLRLGELNALYAELTAKIASIQAQLDIIANVTIPTPVSLTAGLNAALSAVAQIAVQFPSATVNIGASLQADIDATIVLAASIQVKIDILVALIADLNLSLGGSGISAYSYSGRADQMGPELASVLAGGLPGGGGPAQSIQGLVLACAAPSEWTKLGFVLRVA